MSRPLKIACRSIRLTEEDDAKFDRMVGYRKLWSFSDLVAAGLDLLWQEYQASITPAAAPPAPPATKKRGKK